MSSPIHLTPALPEATLWQNSIDESAIYYLRSNPWRFGSSGAQKVFRFCIICRVNRFSDEEWSKKELEAAHIAICEKISCIASYRFVDRLIPPHYLRRVEMHLDHSQIEKEHFEPVEGVHFLFRDDRVYRSLSEMPQGYVDTFTYLERFPVPERMVEIDRILFAHSQKRGPQNAAFIEALKGYCLTSCEISDSMGKDPKRLLLSDLVNQVRLQKALLQAYLRS